MLYAADVYVSDSGEVTVAAGTVFGEIIVWTWRRGAEGGRIVKRLRGHEGSVFAVRFDPGARWIASCSDDRTVRVWDLVSTDAEAEAAERAITGFDEVKGEAKGGRGCVAMGWGHQARPWGVRFLPEENGEVRLASISEDLTARFWGFVPKIGETTLMETKNSWMLHQGKSIWAFALDFERKIMATGGNDGRVGILDYSDDAEIHEEWALEDVVPPTPIPTDDEAERSEESKQATEKVKRKKKKVKPNAFRGYAVVDRERFVATTVYGQIMLYNIPAKTWRLLGTWESLKNWSIVSGWQGTGIVAVGDNEGKLGILDINNGCDWWLDAGGRGKVAELFVGDTAGVLTTSVAAPSFTIHSIRLQDGDAAPIRHTLSLISPAPQNFSPTSALITKRQVILGSRTGDVAIYSLPAPDSPTQEITATSYHPALYGTDTITSLHLSPTAPETLLTTSFSGVYTTHTLPSLSATNITKPGNVTVITGLFFSPTNELHIFGFRGTKFIVHNTCTAADTLSIDCGGAHRSWKFSPDTATPWLVWLQAGKVHLHRSFYPRRTVLKHGAHGREIKTAAYAPSTRLLATGAEDTTIRITPISASGALRENAAVTVKKHTTGVLRLVWSADGARLFSSGGLEELFVFRVRPGPVIGVVLESTLPVPPSEAETRICGLDVRSHEGGYLLATAMSDGLVKMWAYHPTAEKQWRLVAQTVYGTCCVLQARFIDARAVVVAATDGHIAIYQLHPSMGELQQQHRHRVHQSGIKALCITAPPSSGAEEITILTGGDDCALAATTFLYARGAWHMTLCRDVQSAHAAAVIDVVPITGGGAVTVGVDQRVGVWSAELERRGGVHSLVADPGAAVRVGLEGGREGVVVVGVGIESWRVDEI
ncbi:WD40-repeat-containing domain protein [Sphaerosporella brunnea]|uniref:WD40-repeat-containing domain protein n=1 Tax=Sphaerosporella brunnea TaxID=1250544 RepID=A0A5J5EUV8_9PEZI|nr:WD40-repeat-containing domain protein [Sphaerosporella brunnea]